MQGLRVVKWIPVKLCKLFTCFTQSCELATKVRKCTEYPPYLCPLQPLTVSCNAGSVRSISAIRGDDFPSWSRSMPVACFETNTRVREVYVAVIFIWSVKIPSPHESSDADLMPPPVSVSPRPAASTSPSPSSLTASPSPASTGNPQVRYGTKWCNFGRCKMVQVIALFLVFCCCTRSLGTPSKEVMAQVSYMSKLLS